MFNKIVILFWNYSPDPTFLFTYPYFDFMYLLTSFFSQNAPCTHKSFGGELYLHKLFNKFRIWFHETVIKWKIQCERELWHWICDKYISLLRIIFTINKKLKFNSIVL
jgi:hypothetical protein